MGELHFCESGNIAMSGIQTINFLDMFLTVAHRNITKASRHIIEQKLSCRERGHRKTSSK